MNTLEFDSMRSYGRFHNAVTSHTRYIRTPETDKFLSIVLTTSQQRKIKLRKGRVFYRAQVGHLEEDNYSPVDLPQPFSPERMKPLRNKATEGRVNPKGIPCLYLATNEMTAILEVRPWVGSIITVAKFKLVRPLNIADCSRDEEGDIWHHINYAFSTPVSASDNTAEYAPTQVIAELLRENGFEGIMYRSAFGDGRNIALFDVNSAEPFERFVREVEKIKFKVGIRMNPS